MSTEPVSRAERKERTRRAILDAALDLLEDQGFSSLSLRQLTREAGIVPTAFYRHFESLDELGLVLVDESFSTLRAMIRDVRRDTNDPEVLIDRSVDVLAEHCTQHKSHFRFLGREQRGGVAAVRDAIAYQLSLFERELATDLARLPQLADWSTEDLQLLASVFVTIMTATVGDLVDPAAERPAVQQQIMERTRSQARMVVVGTAGWGR